MKAVDNPLCGVKGESGWDIICCINTQTMVEQTVISFRPQKSLSFYIRFLDVSPFVCYGRTAANDGAAIMVACWHLYIVGIGPDRRTVWQSSQVVQYSQVKHAMSAVFFFWPGNEL